MALRQISGLSGKSRTAVCRRPGLVPGELRPVPALKFILAAGTIPLTSGKAEQKRVPTATTNLLTFIL